MVILQLGCDGCDPRCVNSELSIRNSIEFDQDNKLRDAVVLTLKKSGDDPLRYRETMYLSMEDGRPKQFVEVTLVFTRLKHHCQLDVLELSSDFKGPIMSTSCKVVDRTTYAIF